MKLFLISAALVVLGLAAVSDAIGCSDPSPFQGQWVIGVDKKECVALVKERCGNLRDYTTGRWVRGKHRLLKAYSKPTSSGQRLYHRPLEVSLAPEGLLRMEPSATFSEFQRCGNESRNESRRVRTAGHLSKPAQNVSQRVYDQWNAKPVERRKIRYGNTGKPNYNGDNFYTIEV
ncbi:hypothetical protein HPB47_018097 [Ixodes persulcatus]|uniref:Uncharacterized protein n=1 Tax=Ixodes persulcatus TaxID=34615 RepID=A0AC60QP70_IXOPE|nr:hypothetical protein HPB47_018097 [Ixodes persulcatus]